MKIVKYVNIYFLSGMVVLRDIKYNNANLEKLHFSTFNVPSILYKTCSRMSCICATSAPTKLLQPRRTYILLIFYFLNLLDCKEDSQKFYSLNNPKGKNPIELSRENEVVMQHHYLVK